MAIQQTRRFTPDEVICREGEQGDCAYLIERGRVLVYIDKDGVEMPLRVLGEGEVIGEMSLIDGSPRSASCRGISDGRLVIVTKDQLLDRVNAADPVVRLLMQVLLKRLRAQNDRLRGRAPEATPDPADPLASEKKAALERIGLENRIAAGLDNDEFVPFYQPIYDMATGAIRGCEALIRWMSSEGVISPATFMDVMEESSLILKGGEIVIEKSTRDLARLSERFGENFFVSINVSGRQFTRLTFLEHLEAARARAQVPASRIKLELTERIMTEGPQALDTLEKCRAAGYQLAIDDFGTGFSSLQYLAQMPLTDLKIDRSFVMKMLADQKSLLMVKSLIHMADVMGMRLIAEGIETVQQRDLLKSLGVPMGQGFFYARPMPLRDFLKLDARFSD